MSFSLPSFAKINWTLRIRGKRPDGFHELCTIFQTVSLADQLTFEPVAGDIEFSADGIDVPSDERNIVVQAARRLREEFDVREGAAIRLEKRIPSPGGLGGGSSNAAVALVGLSRLWKIDNATGRLSAIAAELGADVPFFLTGGTALGTGRGDVLESLPDISADLMLLVTPPVAVSTAAAFGRFAAPTLTEEAQKRNLSVCRNEAKILDPLRTELTNDLELSVFESFSEIERVKDALIRLGAANVVMSGSGATVAAVFDKKETRQAAEKALDLESTWRKFAVSAISRSEYREALGI